MVVAPPYYRGHTDMLKLSRRAESAAHSNFSQNEIYPVLTLGCRGEHVALSHLCTANLRLWMASSSRPGPKRAPDLDDALRMVSGLISVRRCKVFFSNRSLPPLFLPQVIRSEVVDSGCHAEVGLLQTICSASLGAGEDTVG